MIDYIYGPRAQALPSNSAYSCSNELKPHIRRSARSRTWLKTLCYGATYSFLSFCPSQNLFLSPILLPICLCPPTCLITTLSVFFPQTDPSTQNTEFKSSSPLPPFTSSHYPPNNLSIHLFLQNNLPDLFQNVFRFFLKALSKSPCFLLHTPKPPFSIIASPTLVIIWSRHPDSISIQCNHHTNLLAKTPRTNQVVLPMQM